MKHSIVLKFIAILLCAAALLGVAGTAAGIIVLTAMDLYDRDVDQLLKEQLEDQGQYYVQTTAARHFSMELGGCPQILVDQVHWQGFLDSDWLLPREYGVILRDGEGNILYDDVGDSLREGGATVYTFPIYGQYLHLLETHPSDTSVTQPEDALEGVPVYWVRASHPGRSEGVGSHDSPLGLLEFDENGQLTGFRFLNPGAMLTEGSVTSVTFYDQDDQVLYSLDGAPGYVGEFIMEDGCQVFVPYAIVVNEVPLAVSEPVYSASFYREGLALDMRVGSATEPVGHMNLDSEGNLRFQLYGSFSFTQPLRGLVLCGLDGGVLYDSREWADGGETDFLLLAEEGQVLITAGPNSGIALTAEETPEATPDTVPETTGETQPETVPETASPEPTVPETLPEPPEEPDLSGYQTHTEAYWDYNTQQWMDASYVYLAAPECTGELYVLADSYPHPALIELLRILRLVRSDLFLVMGVCALAFAILTVYLCCAAGHKRKTQEIHAGGLNRLSLDVYLLLAGAGAAGCFLGAAAGIGFVTEYSMENGVLLAVTAAYLGCLLLVGLGFAFVAQIKTPGGYWWRNTLTVRCTVLCWRIVKWCWNFTFRTLPGWCWGLVQGLWRLLTSPIRAVLRWLSRTVGRFYSLLPLTWQWLLGGAVLLLLGLLAWANRNDFWGLLWFLLGMALVLYAAWCFGGLLRSTKRMGQGDLDSQVDSRHMVGSFREFADDLNALGGVAAVAAQKQLKSERMKTELITNVSHDIKTPLTSIINYVDLLRKPHTDREQEQYLEVLDRQSLRLKKLIDDLMEMSKASTGNMTVELTTLDAVEAVNQALGEFADKLDKAQLTPVVRCSRESVPIRADGRLVWRVLSNLLSNAVKYAMPGTRLYVDLLEAEGKVIISLKNISREELNTDADELMERFVRGDDSRNTEGSGLGLNIAKSLMELQKGQLQLLVDGDLFKVTLIFPGK